MNFKKFLFEIKHINPICKKIMKIGFETLFLSSLFSTLILSLYLTTNHTQIVFNIGSLLFKSSTMLLSFLLIYGMIFNKLQQDSSKTI